MADAIAWQNTAVHGGRPALVAPSINVAPIDAGVQLLKIVPKQRQTVVGFFLGEHVPENDKSVVTQICLSLWITGTEARRVLVTDVDIILQNDPSVFPRTFETTRLAGRVSIQGTWHNESHREPDAAPNLQKIQRARTVAPAILYRPCFQPRQSRAQPTNGPHHDADTHPKP